jgi:hypothetical protein
VSAANGPGGVWLFPVRHHSPACAFALVRALEAVRPAQVLVEAPIDFEPLVGALTDPGARPPLAIVSLPAATAEGGGRAAVYPFCAHSPEYVALAWARSAGASVSLIDLPAGHDAMRVRLAAAPDPASLAPEWRLDHNAYVEALCARRGVKDGAALWDALFEAQGGGEDWQGFFHALETHCGHIRTVTPPETLGADATLAREAQMAARLREALDRPGPIAVITGGFHTPALRAVLGAPTEPGRPAVTVARGREAFLVRYGFRQLDQAAGYGAGLPHPAWYDRLWRTLGSGPAREAMTTELLTDFADHLRQTAPGLAFPTPTLVSAILAAGRLAELRGLPRPGRSEIIDAVRSTAVKDALELGRAPVLDALDTFLVGDALGELPPGAAQPPIIGCVRARARALGFSVETGARRTRDLDIRRKPRHAQASRFLFALDLVGAVFGRRIAGPDMLSGWREDSLTETWTYAWSPMVEQALIARAAEGQTLEQLCVAEFATRRARLELRGLGRSAQATAGLMLAVARTGYAGLIGQAITGCAWAMAEDPEARSIVRALSLTASLSVEVEGEIALACADLRRQGFRRLLALFPHLADTPPDQLGALTAALAELAALTGAEDGAIDRPALADAVRAVLAGGPPPALIGAFIAFASLIGAMDPGEAAARIAAALAGAYVEPGARAAVLTGALPVAPRLPLGQPGLLSAIDRFLAGLETESFLGLLPEVRLAFSQLSPSEVDRLADWVAARHGIDAQTLLDPAEGDLEIPDNLAFAERLKALWRADGLGRWLGDPPGPSA